MRSEGLAMGMATNPVNSPAGSERDKHDHERLRHARERSVGFPVGQYLQPPSMLFMRDAHNAFLGDMYPGAVRVPDLRWTIADVA